MSRREPTHAIFVASLTTAAAMLALQLVGGAAGELPLHLRLAMATWVGVGGVAAFAYRMTGARPVLGDVRRANIGWSLLAGVGLAFAGTGALAVEHALIPAWDPVFAAKQVFFEQVIRPGQWSFVPVVVLVTAVGPALCEEVLFRGVLLSWLRRHVGRVGRVLALGILFALLHGDVTVLLPMTYVGAMLTIAAERSGGWGSASATHFALNAFNAAIWANAATSYEPDLWVGLLMVAGGAGVATAGIGRLTGAAQPAAVQPAEAGTGA